MSNDTMVAGIDCAAPISRLQENIEGLERALTYTFADAIREGASVTNQCYGAYSDSNGHLCAKSGAVLALKARHMLNA